MTAPAPAQTVTGKRREFITFLYDVHRNLTADNRYAAADSRAILARLRRSFAGPRQQAEAYQIVFDFDPPEHEQHIWLLAGGLFALHPRPRPAVVNAACRSAQPWERLPKPARSQPAAGSCN